MWKGPWVAPRSRVSVLTPDPALCPERKWMKYENKQGTAKGNRKSLLLKGKPKEEKGWVPRVWPRGKGVLGRQVPLPPPPLRSGSSTRAAWPFRRVELNRMGQDSKSSYVQSGDRRKGKREVFGKVEKKEEGARVRGLERKRFL